MLEAKYFTVEQIENLKKQLEIAEERCLFLVQYLKAENVQAETLGQEVGDIGDYSTLSALEIARANKRELEILLKSAIVIDEVSTNQIGIGTTFHVSLEGDEPETFTLVDSMLGLPIEESYVSKSSPFGMSVLGKKEGDSFEYAVNSQRITGIITEIMKPKQKVKRM